MDSIGILLLSQLACHAVQRVEVVCRIDMNTGDKLLTSVADKAETLHYIRIEMWAAYGIQATVSISEVHRFIFLDHSLNNGLLRNGGHNLSAVDKMLVFKSDEALVIQQR